MSQLSRFSDAGPSSFLGSDIPDDFTSYSMTTPATSLAQDQPAISFKSFLSTTDTGSPIPESLQLVGPDRRKSWVLWSEMNKDDFIRDPQVMCKQCGKTLPHPQKTSNGTNSMKRHLSGAKCVKAAFDTTQQQNIQESLQFATIKVFNDEDWTQTQIELIANSHLPFQFLAHKGLINLIQYACLAPTMPNLLSPTTARRQLGLQVKRRQAEILSYLPPGAKISVALDCWTSPFQQAFIAITRYFIDKNWQYREILLGFEPLYDRHTSINLSAVLLETLQQHDLVDRVLALTTDNASNNKTLLRAFNDAIESPDIPEELRLVRIPCLAHVIQLSLKDLLCLMKVNLKNDNPDQAWSDEEAERLRQIRREKGISYTLAKIRGLAIFINASP
ncbi:conserved hypothetical protein [Talaromyces stipitatus ATCC 10500]|uniref:BED-type domain-containing protein n=1 Tax=Talaromyces stipitatus (strain ATCC 10500 / CBS 375.48 / QM 6759 / NRRL 1006) TaxID=441959 RepID=B8MJP9_TALSN|nr:uncharacterized protein TSTA_051850 [Talaromyces stipitatus ATCC 10500]EED15748.1 conserved hypothetical protein [Talaromyces stipitatus ATCC 10500]